MIHKLFSALFLIAVVSCAKHDPQAQKQNLSGYWQIETVEMPSGKKKGFNMNAIVDHIEVKGDSGVRTKVSPKLDGTFNTNGVSEKFTLKIEDDSLRMYYKTPFDEWKETVIQAKDSVFSVINRDNKIYEYKKFHKFDFQE